LGERRRGGRERPPWQLPSGSAPFFSPISDLEEAELRACRLAIDLAKKAKVPRVILETDSLSAVTKLVQREKDRSRYGSLVEEIKGMLRSMEDHEVRWARRSANGVAHVLAKEGCGSEINQTWFIVPPSSIVNLLASDLSGQ
jgi:ribonuclease HI